MPKMSRFVRMGAKKYTPSVNTNAINPSTNIPQPNVEQPERRLLRRFRLGGGIGRRGAGPGGGLMT